MQALNIISHFNETIAQCSYFTMILYRESMIYNIYHKTIIFKANYSYDKYVNYDTLKSKIFDCDKATL